MRRNDDTHEISDSERRAVRRVTPTQSVGVRLKTSLPARIVDISSRGAQIEVASSLKPNVTSELRFQLADGEMTVKAHVRRCRAWGFGLDEKQHRVLLYRAGVEFAELDRPTVKRLRQYFTLPESGIVNANELKEKSTASRSTTLTPEELVRGILASTNLPSAPRRDGPVKIRISPSSIRPPSDSDDTK